MPKIKINKSTIDKLTCPLDRDEIYYWDIDGNPTGFALKVLNSGSKIFIYQYRLANGRGVRKIKIGKLGDISLDLAREKALELSTEVRNFKDPSLRKHECKNTLVFEEVARKYMKEYSEVNNKPKTILENRRKFERDLNPLFKDFPINEISSRHISKLKFTMKDKQVSFNRCYALLSKMFNLCEVWGIRERNSNPCLLVGKYTKAEKKRRRFLSYEELRKLFDVLNESRCTENPELKIADAVVDLICLLIYTGARKGEVLQFQWQNIDWESKQVKVNSKTGDVHDEANYIELSEQAIDIIKNIKKSPYIPVMYNNEFIEPYIENGIKYNPFVISNPETGIYFKDPKRAWEKLLKIAGIKNNLRMHDLRHSFASFSADVGVSYKMTGKLLRHSSLSTTQRYVHFFDNKVNQATNMVGEYIKSFDSRIQTEKPMPPTDDNNNNERSIKIENQKNVSKDETNIIQLHKKQNIG